MSTKNEEGISTIEIDLEEDEYESLIGIFVRTSLSKESLSVFNDYLEAGDSVPHALSRAVINEQVNITLLAKVEQHQFEEALKNNNNKEDNNDNIKDTR